MSCFLTYVQNQISSSGVWQGQSAEFQGCEDDFPWCVTFLAYCGTGLWLCMTPSAAAAFHSLIVSGCCDPVDCTPPGSFLPF